MSRYLPPVVKGDSCVVDSHNLRYSIDPDGRLLYTYTVTWHDSDQSRPTTDEGTSYGSELRVAGTPEFSFLKVSPKKEMSAEEIQICKRLAPRNTPQSKAQEYRCDGPCGRIKPISEMTVMGQCDHYICQDCLENAPAVERAGGVGCPNTRCYQTDLACLCTDRRRRDRKIKEILQMSPHRRSPWMHTDKGDDFEIRPCMTKSVPCLHLVDVRLTTFFPQRNSDKICRQQQIIEMYDNYTMAQAITILQEYARVNSKEMGYGVYYCPDGRINDRSSWRRVREADLSRKITTFGADDQRIDIIFDVSPTN